MRILLVLTLLIPAAAWLPTAAAAQVYRGAIGYGAGWMRFGSFNEGVGERDLALDPGPLLIGQVERSYGAGYFGVRGTVAFAQRPLETAADERDVNTWLFDGGVVLRAIPVVSGRGVSPYLTAGAGVVSYGLGEGPQLVLAEEGVVYGGDDERRFAALAGVGVDLLPGLSLWGTPIAVRLEGADHVVFDSPFDSLEGEDLGPIHNPRLSLSLIGMVDLLP